MYFSVTGLGNLSGSLTIIAAFEPVSPRRVSITFESASLVREPDVLVRCMCVQLSLPVASVLMAPVSLD